MTDSPAAPAAPAGAPATGVAAPAGEPTNPDPSKTGDGKGAATAPVIEDPAAVLAALEKANKEAEKYRKQVADFEREKLSDTEKAAKDLADAQQRAAVAEAKADRATVAAAKGVPVSLLPETGDKAAMEAAADALIAFKGEGPRAPAPNAGQGAGNGAPAKMTPDEWLRSHK